MPDQLAPAGLDDPRVLRLTGWNQRAEPLSTIERLVLAGAAAALSPARIAAFAEQCQRMPAGEWGNVLACAIGHNVASLLWQVMTTHDLTTFAPPDVWHAWTTTHHDALIHHLRLAYALTQILDACATSQIPVIALKGPYLAQRLYQAFGPRPCTDIDLMAHPGVAPGAAFRALDPVLLALQGRGVPVEINWDPIHRATYRTAFARRALWRRSEPGAFFGRPVWRLARFDELRYLCVHHVIHHRASRWLWLVDIACLLQGMVDVAASAWDTFAQETIASELALPVALGLLQAANLLDAPAPPDIITALLTAADGEREQRRWQVTWASRRSWQDTLRLLRIARSLGEAGLLLRSLYWPSLPDLREYGYAQPGAPTRFIRIKRLAGLF